MKRWHAALLCSVLLLPLGRGLAQLSPGPLVQAHADLEGMTRCVSCHPLGRKEMDVACLDCHREIEWLQTNQRGLHARVIDRECSSCHADHAGREFNPIPLDPKNFAHADAGWPLEGAHAALQCEQCHRREFWKAPARSQRGKDSPRLSYLGMDLRCISCHLDDHDRQLGEDCKACHGMADFAQAAGFQHDKTSFPLRGKHREQTCVKCHTAKEVAGKSMLFPARDVTQCSACHKDPHVGRLGPRCADCHSETGWNTNIGAGFDHTKTRFALAGAHRTVKCERCHDEKTGWGAKPAFASCASCHKDPHFDTAQKPLLKGDCKQCHDERSFTPALFDVIAHAKTRFALEGKHRKVACRDCHKSATLPATGKDSLGFAWKFEDRSCASCHPGAHGTALASVSSQFSECTVCHDNERFKPSRFGVAEHAKTKFALDAAHVDVLCARCHAADRAELPRPAGAAESGKAKLVFVLQEKKCADCHADPHRAGERSTDCQRCHLAERWSPTRIDIKAHAKLGLDLKGAHAAIPCVECHREFGRPNKGSTLLAAANARSLPFFARVRKCVDCHASISGGRP